MNYKFKIIPDPKDSQLPTGSPIPSSHSYLKSTRRSSKSNQVGHLGFRIVTERKSILDSPINNSKQSMISNDAIFDNDTNTIVNFDDISPKKDQSNISAQSNLIDSLKNSNINNSLSPSPASESKPQISDEMNDSDSDEIIEIGDFNKTPLQYKYKSPKTQGVFSTPTKTPTSNINKYNIMTLPAIQTIGSKNNIQYNILGRIVKKAAVSSLKKLKNNQETKQVYNTVLANFFQVFDEWSRNKEKEQEAKLESENKKRMGKQMDFNSAEQTLLSQLQMAKEKIKDLSQEAEKWKDESNTQNNQNNSNDNSSQVSFTDFNINNSFDDVINKRSRDNSNPIKIKIDYDYKLTKDIIYQIDQVSIKVQTDEATTDKVIRMANDCSVLENEIISSNVTPNIDQLLGH